MVSPLAHQRIPPSLSSLLRSHTLRPQPRSLVPLSRIYNLSPRVSSPPQTRCLSDRRKQEPRVGTTTPIPEDLSSSTSPPNSSQKKPPFYFEAGYALFAKRPSRPFPPPFLSPPSGSFSEPLSTHDRSRDRRMPTVDGEMIRGVTNGDDAVVVEENWVGANDGVGAWATKERGHAALWSRLILHFWAQEASKCGSSKSPSPSTSPNEPNPITFLQTAYEKTQTATTSPNPWYGTTTFCAALLSSTPTSPPHPLLYITQLGDSQILVLRPSTGEILYKTTEQWHWFDCPRQLGTNSPDTPSQNAVCDTLEIEEDDIVLAMTDGVIDNLWEHEVVENVCQSVKKWQEEGGVGEKEMGKEKSEQTYADGMRFVAQELLNAARKIAEDPFAESPYMEKAIDEGLSIEGGKLDDISVVAAQCKRRKG
ncbi:hypothetical protein M011DRAFT_396253 [Sporormia fimetaria CBS 119925]|uniref:Protein phosphatase n=1 Tax=Sporormia fimetaria CBS 119925 TaxID=1340428 RepID=A0A6A6VLG5_9PLEO|nr:hypothetical protein M011DRAFT_396253 [Sporormia fimetaria CBS 119925]